MFDIKRTRNEFKGFCATILEDEFDGFIYVLEAAAAQYKKICPKRLEGRQKLFRAWTEFTYFYKKKLEEVTIALSDVMFVYILSDV